LPFWKEGDAGILGLERPQSKESFVLFADQLCHGSHGKFDVLRRRDCDSLYIRPVFGPIEEGLEHDQGGAVEDRRFAPLEPNPDDRRRDGLMKRDVVEEDINRNPVPEETRLTIAFDLLDIGLSDLYLVRKGLEHLSGIPGIAEDVDVEIAGSAGLLNAICERDGTAERVWKRFCLKRIVNDKELVDQLAYFLRPLVASFSARLGYSSSDRGRNGSASASSSTWTRILLARSVSTGGLRGVS
jgi:hypothetical protein